MVAESKRLERLVRDLLDLARLNQQVFAVTPQPVDLAELAAEAVGRHEAEARRVGVSLAADVNGAAPATADPDRVLQFSTCTSFSFAYCTDVGALQSQGLSQILAITIPACVIGIFVTSLVVNRMWKDLDEDPEVQARNTAGELVAPGVAAAGQSAAAMVVVVS